MTHNSKFLTCRRNLSSIIWTRPVDTGMKESGALPMRPMLLCAVAGKCVDWQSVEPMEL